MATTPFHSKIRLDIWPLNHYRILSELNETKHRSRHDDECDSDLQPSLHTCCEDVVFAKSYLRLLDHSNLHIMRRPSHLTILNYNYRVESESVINIAKKFPMLEKLELDFRDVADSFNHEREKRRSSKSWLFLDFAQTSEVN